MILVDDTDRGIVDLLQVSARLRNDRQREGPDDKRDQHEIMPETDELLSAEPKNISGLAHRLPHCSCLRRKARLSRRKAGMKAASAQRLAASSAKPSPLVKVPMATRRKYVIG